MISNKIIAKEFFMELVYLWVKNYKNIVEQGFNFSPRFRCEYDEKTNELIIDENEDYVSIFPDNINITAIVGENGSGKSKLLKLLIKCLNNNILMMNDTNYLFLIEKDKTLYYISAFSVNTKFKCVQIRIPLFKLSKNIDNKIKKFLDEIYSSLYDYSLSFTMNNFFDTSIEQQCYPNKKLSIEDIEKIDRRNIIYYLFENNHKDIFGNYFEPSEILLEPSFPINDKDTLNNIVNLQKNLKNTTEHFLFVIYLYLVNQIRRLSLNEMFIELKEITNFENFSMILFEKISNLNPESFSNLEMYKSQRIQIINKIKNIFNYSKEIKESQIKFENILNSDMNIIPREFIINIENFKNSNLFNIFEELPCFEINFRSSNGMKYNDLSNGEKTALRVRFYIEKIIRDNKTKNFLFLLDEANNDLHPLWQKKLLLFLIDTFKNRKEKIHFILTSHSPFILSDLPKQNVIFLEKEKRTGNCINATDKVDINPFGANIHTLLSHGFFMKDGLMGEFAKEKIDTAITYLNKKILTKEELDYCENIISIIGEPIIKRELQRKLDSKRLSKLDKIDEIEEQMKLLAHRLEMIRKNQK
jgi:predicted ATP-dependent endonuclease of OLD family